MRLEFIYLLSTLGVSVNPACSSSNDDESREWRRTIFCCLVVNSACVCGVVVVVCECVAADRRLAREMLACLSHARWRAAFENLRPSSVRVFSPPGRQTAANTRNGHQALRWRDAHWSTGRICANLCTSPRTRQESAHMTRHSSSCHSLDAMVSCFGRICTLARLAPCSQKAPTLVLRPKA